MNTVIVLAIGPIVGGLAGAALFFVPEEPNKVQTFLASILRCMLVSLLTGFSLSRASAWWEGVGFGSLYGLATILVVILAEGGFKKKGKEAQYLLLAGVVTGAVIGLLIVFFGIRS